MPVRTQDPNHPISLRGQSRHRLESELSLSLIKFYLKNSIKLIEILLNIIKPFQILISLLLECNNSIIKYFFLKIKK